MTLFSLFLTFAKIGLFTIGGGYAMLPLIQEEAVHNFAWITQQEFIDIIAVAQITPGAISINSATYVGFRVAGLIGAVSATLGLFLPSLVIVIIVAGFMMRYQDNIWRMRLFSGIRPVVAGLIAYAVWIIARTVIIPDGISSFRLIPGLIALAALGLLRNPWKKIHPIAVLGLCAAGGLILL